MGIIHEKADVGAEADQFREVFNSSGQVVTSDTHDDKLDKTTIEYVNGEGDPPFIKYRLTLEAIDTVSVAQYATLKDEYEKREKVE